MGTLMDHQPGDRTDPFEQLRGCDRGALAALFDRYRERLRRMVELRIDARIRARLDASDVLQEAFLDVQTARERVGVTRVAIEQADDNLRQATDRYKNALGTNTEVLDAVTLRLRSSGNYYNALYNWVLSVMRLRRAVGDL